MLDLKAYHIPEVPMRLISPQEMKTLDAKPIEFSTFTGHRGRKGYLKVEVKPDKLHWKTSSPAQTKRMELNPRNNLSWLTVRTPQAVEDTVACF